MLRQLSSIEDYAMLSYNLNPNIVKPNHQCNSSSRKQIVAGLPYTKFEALRKALQLSASRLAEAMGIQPRTLQRRRKEGCFTFVESDRLARFLNLYQQTAEALESKSAAAAWLVRANASFDGQAPLEYASTEPGYQELLLIIEMIADDSYG